MVSKAQRIAIEKWNKGRYGVLSVKLKLDEISDVRKHISEKGYTLAGFVRRACYAQMERDKEADRAGE